MVAVQIREHAALPHGDALTACVVVPRHVAGSAAPLEVVAYIIRGYAAQRGVHMVVTVRISSHSNPSVTDK